jgi:hypothetical protein
VEGSSVRLGYSRNIPHSVLMCFLQGLSRVYYGPDLLQLVEQVTVSSVWNKTDQYLPKSLFLYVMQLFGLFFFINNTIFSCRFKRKYRSGGAELLSSILLLGINKVGVDTYPINGCFVTVTEAKIIVSVTSLPLQRHKKVCRFNCFRYRGIQ